MGETLRRPAMAVFVLASGCTFGASGASSGSGSDGATDTEPLPTSTMDGGPGPATTMTGSAEGSGGTTSVDAGTGTTTPDGDTTSSVDDGDTGGSSTTDAPATGTSGSSTGVDDCSGPGEALIVFAADAEIVPPMQLTMSELLPGNPMVASSAVADAGTATFTFEVACEGEFRIWGLVWDETPGADNGADSFYATVDGEPPGEYDWYYGCQTGGSASGWSYQLLTDWVMFDCVYDDLELPLAPGPHTLTLRNREPGSGLNIAAIAAIVVSSDPATDPADLYDPAP